MRTTLYRILQALQSAGVHVWSWLRRPYIGFPLLAVFLLLMFLLGWVNFLDSHHLGIARNTITGEMKAVGPGGIYVTGPWWRVARVETRTMRVTVESGGRGYSGKLIQFQPEHWQEFVDTEGFRYWWWSNRISFNWGYDVTYRGVPDVLRGYAYSPKVDEYKFIEVLAEYESAE